MAKTYKTIRLLIALILSFSLTNLHAQDALGAAGGELSGSNGTVSYTIGQVAYSTITDANNTITEGVQQPYEIFVVTALDNSYDTIELLVFPNPVTNFLILKAVDADWSDLSYQLYDTHAKLLKNGLVTGSSDTIIKMDEQPAATYFLSITNQEKVIKTFKIIKNQ